MSLTAVQKPSRKVRKLKPTQVAELISERKYCTSTLRPFSMYYSDIMIDWSGKGESKRPMEISSIEPSSPWEEKAASRMDHWAAFKTALAKITRKLQILICKKKIPFLAKSWTASWSNYNKHLDYWSKIFPQNFGNCLLVFQPQRLDHLSKLSKYTE